MSCCSWQACCCSVPESATPPHWPPLIAQTEFTKADVQRVVPLIVAIGQGTYAFAPAAFGAIRSLSAGEATWVFATAAVIQALAIAAFVAGRPRRRTSPLPAALAD